FRPYNPVLEGRIIERSSKYSDLVRTTQYCQTGSHRMTTPEMEPNAPPSAENFHSHALQRIHRLMVVIGVAALIASFPLFGWRTTLGFAIGAAVSGVNFYWLRKVVAGMAAAAVCSGKAPSSRGVVRRFLLRYFLMAIAA